MKIAHKSINNSYKTQVSLTIVGSVGAAASLDSAARSGSQFFSAFKNPMILNFYIEEES